MKDTVDVGQVQDRVAAENIGILIDQQGVDVLHESEIVFVDGLRAVFLADLLDDVQQVFAFDLHLDLEKIEKEVLVILLQRQRQRIEVRLQIVRDRQAIGRLPEQLRQGEEEIGVGRQRVVHVDQTTLTEEFSHLADALLQLTGRHR